MKTINYSLYKSIIEFKYNARRQKDLLRICKQIFVEFIQYRNNYHEYFAKANCATLSCVLSYISTLSIKKLIQEYDFPTNNLM